VKAVEAENKKKLDEKKKGSGAKTASTSPAPSVTPEFKDGKPLFGSKPASGSSECRSLFDTPTDTAEDDEVGASSGDDSPNCSAAAG
jgi:hypothetical protein